MTRSEIAREHIAKEIASNRIVVFMKGSHQAPRCGFSGQVCSILDNLGVNFRTLDVLSDADLRDAIKAYSNWPTIPQLYVDGQFVGGCDIVTELHRTGELQKMVGASNVERLSPTVRITDAAARAIAAADIGGPDRLRLEIGPDQEYDLLFDSPKWGDIEVADNGITLRLGAAAARKADGLVIDYLERASGAGFKIENPSQIEGNLPAQPQ
jgi:monothiol glutaredoxin